MLSTNFNKFSYHQELWLFYFLFWQAASARSSASSMGADKPIPDAGVVDNNKTKENNNSTTAVRLADKIHCIRTNNITDEYELKEEIGVSTETLNLDV